MHNKYFFTFILLDNREKITYNNKRNRLTEVKTMAIKTINKISSRDDGFSESIACPECGKEVCLKLFTTIDKTAVAKLSGKDKNLYIAVCPNCSTVYSVNKNYINEKNAGTFVTITKEDLKVISKL